MKKSEFSNIDDRWFRSIYSSLGIDIDALESGPPAARNTLLRNPFDSSLDRYNLDLSHTVGATLFDLLNLFLVIDYIQAVENTIHIKLPISSSTEGEFNKKYFTISKFNEINRGGKSNLSKDERIKFDRSEYVYTFLSFCQNFGFFDALKFMRTSHQLVFEDCIEPINDEFLSQLYTYRGARGQGSKVFGLLPIRELADVYNFRDGSIIENWANSLPPDIRKFPVFSDGEFSRVFGYQLARNIAEHSGEEYKGDFGSLGAIAMRILPPSFSGARWLVNSFPKTMHNVFKRNENKNGILEICVGDRGVGIVNTLKSTLTNYHNRFGFTQEINDIDTIAFALDELGTSKPLKERLVGVHALHRILKCIIKYHGVMRLRTHGKELIYDTASADSIKRGQTNLGLYPSFINNVIHPFGLQIQVLIPLTQPPTSHYTNIARKEKYLPQNTEPFAVEVIPLTTYFEKDFKDDINTSLLVQLSDALMEVPNTKTIVFDFSGNDWTDEDISRLLAYLKRVIHTHKCIGVNLTSGVAKLLRIRELEERLEDFHGVKQLRTFFDVLSSKHCLFPVMDFSFDIWWYGLGSYNLDGILSYIFKSEDFISNKTLNSKFPASVELKDKNLNLYLSNNREFLSYGKKGWKTKISMADFEYALSVTIHSKFNNIIKKHQCLKEEGLYKLPARKDFTSGFFQSTSLLQDNVLAHQIGDWAAYAVRNKIDVFNGGKKILLVCATSPAELFAKAISISLPKDVCHIINIGHYSSLDKEKILDKGGWDSSAIIVTDVIDSIRTVKQIIFKLNEYQIVIDGVISLISFCDKEKAFKESRIFQWDKVKYDNDTDELVDLFSLYSMRRPDSVKDVDVFSQEDSSFDDEKLYLVEPFSLEIFPYSALSQTKFSKTPKARFIKKRIEAIEEVGAIRAGHWVYGAHHFLVTTCITKILRDDTIAGQICYEIVNICVKNKIDHILLPLHSQISFILSRVISSLKISANMEVDHTFCLSTRVLTDKDFYVLPNKLKNLIEAYSNQKVGLRLLIIDDAVASGRTMETILRSIVINARKHAKLKSPIDYIHSYAILDRQGRARGTLLTGSSKYQLHGDGEWVPPQQGHYEFDFKYERWIDVDMPVDEKATCSLCAERSDLFALTKMLSNLPSDHSILQEIKRRIKNIEPFFLDSPKFEEAKERKLPWPVEIGSFKAKTVELALWEFYNLTHRGCPIIYFINWLDRFDNNKSSDSEKEYPEKELKNLLELKTIIIKEIFSDWARLSGQWAAYKFEQYLKKEVEKNPVISVIILAAAGKALAKATAAPKVLKRILRHGLSKLLLTTYDKDKNCNIRYHFAMGCKLFCVYNNFYNLHNKKHDELIDEKNSVNLLDEIKKIDKKQGRTNYSKQSVLEIINLNRSKYYEVDFVAEFREILNQTVRPGRHMHSHLLISYLSKFAKNKKIYEADKMLLRDRLLTFNKSFEIVLKHFPALFSPDVNAAYQIFHSKIDYLQKRLSEPWPDNIIPQLVEDRVDWIKGRFPHQFASPFYKALCRTQIHVGDLLENIKKKGEKKGYSMRVVVAPGLDDLHIMVPNLPDIQDGLLKNYTYGVTVDKDFCAKPHIHILVKEKEGANVNEKIIVNIFSNLQHDDQNHIRTGPGINEFFRPEFKLFGIKGAYHGRYDKIIDGIEYSVKISIEFFKGVPKL